MFKITTRHEEIWGVFLGLDGAHLTRIKGGSLQRYEVDSIDKLPKKTRKAKRVIAAIGSKGIIYKNAVLPGDINDSEIKEAARWQFHEIENILEYEITYKKTDFKPDDNINVICIAIPKQLIEAFGENNSEIFTDLDLRPFAIWRGYKLSFPGNEPIILAVNSPDGLTVVCGRNKIEYIREIPITLNLELEKMRTATYYRRAFDAGDAVFADIDGDQAASFISAGCALAYRDTGFINLLPKQYQRASLNIGQTNRTGLITVLCAVMLFLSCIPYGFCCWHNKETAKQQEIISRNTEAALQVDEMGKQIEEYNKVSTAIKKQFVSPYTLILDNIRHAIPVDVVLKKLDINEKERIMLSQNQREEDTKEKEEQEKEEQEKEQGDNNNQQAAPQDDKEQGDDKDQQSETKNDKEQKAEEQPQQAVKDRTGSVSCRPDTLYVSGKSADVKSVGLFTDNLLQLGYIKNIVVNYVTYGDSGYSFSLTADIDYGIPSQDHGAPAQEG